ncbi:MAG: sulfurtransferase TusA family protein [Zestosphaera sp.]
MVYEVLDLRGIPCPEPLIRVVRVIDTLSIGCSLRVLLDNMDCVKLIKEAVEGFELGSVETIPEGNSFILIIKVGDRET